MLCLELIRSCQCILWAWYHHTLMFNKLACSCIDSKPLCKFVSEQFFNKSLAVLFYKNYCRFFSIQTICLCILESYWTLIEREEVGQEQCKHKLPRNFITAFQSTVRNFTLDMTHMSSFHDIFHWPQWILVLNSSRLKYKIVFDNGMSSTLAWREWRVYVISPVWAILNDFSIMGLNGHHCTWIILHRIY